MGYRLSKMIISASYKTDIPAFYGDWFLNRLAAGYCLVANPYGGPVQRVALDRGAVDGFIFWTRNAAPFGAALDRVAELGYPYLLHYTITGYPKALDAATPAAAACIADFRGLADKWGGRRLVWRYDPVLLSTLTPARWHAANFAKLARHLRGATDEVVLSFAQIYRKTRSGLNRAARGADFAWSDPIDTDKRSLLAELASSAADNGMRASLCGQPDLLPGLLSAGLGEASCIDAHRLSDIAGHQIEAGGRSHRKGCACAGSKDIGAYDTCPHGCAYCYAVHGRGTAKDRLAAHDAEAEILI